MKISNTILLTLAYFQLPVSADDDCMETVWETNFVTVVETTKTLITITLETPPPLVVIANGSPMEQHCTACQIPETVTLTATVSSCPLPGLPVGAPGSPSVVGILPPSPPPASGPVIVSMPLPPVTSSSVPGNGRQPGGPSVANVPPPKAPSTIITPPPSFPSVVSSLLAVPPPAETCNDMISEGSSTPGGPGVVNISPPGAPSVETLTIVDTVTRSGSVQTRPLSGGPSIVAIPPSTATSGSATCQTETVVIIPTAPGEKTKTVTVTYDQPSVVNITPGAPPPCITETIVIIPTHSTETTETVTVTITPTAFIVPPSSSNLPLSNMSLTSPSSPATLETITTTVTCHEASCTSDVEVVTLTQVAVITDRSTVERTKTVT